MHPYTEAGVTAQPPAKEKMDENKVDAKALEALLGDLVESPDEADGEGAAVRAVQVDMQVDIISLTPRVESACVSTP